MPVRLLKPTLRTSERWNRSSYFARCFYIALLNLVDDYGRYEAHPALLASECFPYGDENGMPVPAHTIDGGLRALASKDLILVYEKDGKNYIQITRWHERVRTDSKYPGCKGCRVIYGCQPNDGQMTANDSQVPDKLPSLEEQHLAKVIALKAQRENDSQMTDKCPSNDGQMLASPPSPSPVPTPTPTPPPAGVCVPASVKFSEENAIGYLRSELGALYNRPQRNLVGAYEEETALAEVARRPDFKAELGELKAYRIKLPSDQKRFFPQSMVRLLEKWQETLDKARTYRRPQADKSIIEKDAEKMLKWANSL